MATLDQCMVKNLCLNLLIVFLGLNVQSCVVAQVASSEKQTNVYDLNIKSRIVEIDNLGRFYLCDEKNRLINYKATFTESYRYANNRSGQISDIDVTNPLKITVFYDDFNHVKVFDNTLTVITEWNLSTKFVDISACASSNDGNLWVYDPTQFRLIKTNDQGQVMLESSNVNDFGMVEVKISSIREKSNIVVLMDKEKGFYFFDNLGQYIFHYAATNIINYQFDGNHMFYFTSEGLKAYNLTSKEEHLLFKDAISDSSPPLKNVLFHQGKYYLVYNDGIKIMQN